MAPITRSPRLLFVVSEDWYFLSHRVELALAAARGGFEVGVAAHLGGRRADVESLPIAVFDLDLHRGSLSPVTLFQSVRTLRAIVRRWHPDIVNSVALRTALVTGVAVQSFRNIAVVNTLAGLGYAFSNADLKAKLLRRASEGLIRFLFARENVSIVVQNDDDRRVLQRLVQPERVRVIPGSGIDVSFFERLPEPRGKFTVAFVGRILRDKGVEDLVEALRQLRAAGSPVRAILAGRTDPGNPSSFEDRVVHSWVSEGLVDWLGEVRDVREVWKDAHVAVLPSYREGLPKALLEAAACGRALIATDVPGCRAVVRDRETGLLVSVRRPAELAAAIDEMRVHPIARMEMGRRGRALVEQEFSAANIQAQFVSLFQEVITRGVVSPSVDQTRGEPPPPIARMERP